MNNNYIVADFNKQQMPRGAEIVDDNIIYRTGLKFISCKELNTIGIESKNFYIISNFTGLSEDIKLTLSRLGNYAIFEHDYKIHLTRQPNRYPNNIFPSNELINLPFYKKAKAVFLQSQDHFDCFISNNISANFVKLTGSIWSEDELKLLESLYSESKLSYKACILDDLSPDKGTDIAFRFCKENNLDYELLPKTNKEEFYRNMAKYSALVYFPIVKESFCRLVVEARCLGMNVITNKTYGAVKEPWFNLSGKNMIEFIRNCSNNNIELIKRTCNI